MTTSRSDEFDGEPSAEGGADVSSEGGSDTRTGYRPSPLDVFDPIDFETWRQRVEEELGGRPLSTLRSQSTDGTTLEPLYSPENSTVAPAMPGVAPFRRGTRAGGSETPWRIAMEYDDPRRSVVARQLSEEIERGVEVLWLRPDARFRTAFPGDRGADEEPSGGLPLHTTDGLVEWIAGVDLTRVSVVFEAGGNPTASAALWLDGARRQGVAWSELSGCWGGDPLAALAVDGILPWSLEACIEDLAGLAMWSAREAPGMRSALVSTRPWHDAGASPADEVAYALASGVETLRWLTDAGMSIDDACRQILFSLSVGREFFVEIAKLRAFRQLWTGLVTRAGGSAEAAAPALHGRSSAATRSQRAPWLNLLRGAAEGFAAVVGGVDSLSLSPLDEALGASTSESRRHAIQAHHLLAEEAHLGRVADPAGGSWTVESITDQLGRRAWEVFRQIEAEGGLAAALTKGWVGEQLEERSHQRRERLARRVAKVIGVNEFPNLAEEALERTTPRSAPNPPESFPPARAAARLEELTSALEGPSEPGEVFSATVVAVTAGASVGDLGSLRRRLAPGAPPVIDPLPVRRWSAPFEELRDASDAWQAARGRRPRLLLVPLGSKAESGPRNDFARNLFAAGGIEASLAEDLAGDGTESAKTLAGGFDPDDFDGAVLCGPDGLYPGRVPEVGPLLKSAGARWIFLAGRPGEHETTYRDAGVDTFVFLGCDALAVLEAFLGDLEVV